MQSNTPAPAVKSKKANYLAMACILLAGSLWGCIGIFNRGIIDLGVSASSIVMIRNFGALVLLAVLFLVMDRNIFKIRLRHLPYFFGTGCISVLVFSTCYFYSQTVSSLAVCAILLYTAPTFVVIMSTIIFKDRFTKKKLAALIIAFSGCTFAIGIWGGEGLTLSVKGLLLGLGSGFFYALYSIFGRFALQHYQPFTVTFYTFLFSGIGSLFMVRGEDLKTVASTPAGIGLSLGLMVLCSVLPYIFYTKGLNDLGDSGKASILASIEPVVASIVGIIAFGEPMTIGVILGLGCILVSVYILR